MVTGGICLTRLRLPPAFSRHRGAGGVLAAPGHNPRPRQITVLTTNKPLVWGGAGLPTPDVSAPPPPVILRYVRGELSNRMSH